MAIKALIPTVVFAACAAAQQQPATPTQRPPDPAAYNLAARIANGEAAAPEAVRPKKKRTEMPEAIEVERVKPLNLQARAGLNLSRSWSENGPVPEAKNGRVIFHYGQTLPTVVCAIFKACEIDLEPGEKLSPDAIDWGDTRFTIASRTAGSGPNQFTYLVVKATAVGLDTTLTIGTDRRAYFLRLVSTDSDYIARVAFSYPEEEISRKREEEKARLDALERAKQETAKLAELNTAGPLRNWSYTVEMHGKDAAFLKPESIADDGVHTHIKLSAEARYRGLPEIQIDDAQGPIPANRYWEGNELIVDALFAHACLLESVGKKQQRACITNHGLTGKAN